MRLIIRAICFVLLIMPLMVGAANRCNLESCGGKHNCKHQRTKAASSSGTGSTGKWRDDSTPKRDWSCVQIKDLETANYKCDMCKANLIRYVHTMTHSDHASLDVGCICAGHMSDDVAGSKKREKYFSKRASRRNNFPSLLSWEKFQNGRQYLKNYKDYKGHKKFINIVKAKNRNSYTVNIGYKYLDKRYSSIKAAKLAAFDILWPAKLRC